MAPLQGLFFWVQVETGRCIGIAFQPEVSLHNNQLLSVEKPVRYLGGEMGAVRKERSGAVRLSSPFPMCTK